eukprot:PhM_4_TR18806/c0_g1_i3/m.91507
MVFSDVCEFYWVNGPEAGMSINGFRSFDSSEPSCGGYQNSVWLWGPGNVGGITSAAYGKWDDMTSAVQVYYTCEFGGTPGSQAFRGVTRFDVRTSRCYYPLWRTWAEPGICRSVPPMISGYGETKKFKLFTSDVLSDITTESAFAIASFGVYIPDDTITVCVPMDVVTTGVKTIDSTRQLHIEQVGLVSTAVAVFDTIYVTPCPRGVDHIDTYTFQWYLTPHIEYWQNV